MYQSIKMISEVVLLLYSVRGFIPLIDVLKLAFLCCYFFRVNYFLRDKK